MKAVFMGTPEFAVPCLEKLNEYCEVVCVVTQTDKPKGRGKTLQSPPVKIRADELGIPCIQPKTLRDEEVQKALAAYGADVFVVVAYGKILPKEVLDIPPMGCINVHGSILPEYRGAAPMQRSLIDGKKMTGITTMYMNEGLDTGDMLLKEEIAIPSEMNYGELSDIMSKMGAELLIKTLDGLSDGSIEGTPQNGELATYAQKIDKSELKIDFSKSAESIHNLIRGVYPSLSAYGYTENAKGKKMIKFASSSFISENGDGVVGEVILCDDKRSEIHVRTGEGVLVIKELIPEGKGKMRSADYIRGRQIKKGDIVF